jgi:RNA polymerase sigma-70 factor (ECF subfamily)
MESRAGSFSSQARALFQRGRAAYPALALAPAAFEAHLAACRIPGPDPVVDLADLFAEDLYLAAACAERIAGAAEAFQARCGTAIRAAVGALSRSPPFCDEIEQQVYEDLLLGRADAGPRIRGYSGHGPLVRWATVVAQRAALMMLRSEASQARARDAAALERVERSLHGEAIFLKGRYGPVVNEALTRALAELPARDRLVLHLYVVGGAGVTRIGKMYGVSPSTVSRWLARTRAEILQKTQGLLGARLSLGTAEIDSLMALVASQLDISVSDLLAP